MSLAADCYSLVDAGAIGIKQDFLGMGPLPGHQLMGIQTAVGGLSPTNSSQSDTATTADAPGGLGSVGAAGDVASRPSAGRAASAASYDPKREWMYRLVTFPHYFTPCTSCCSSHATPKREQLMTLFDTRAPHRVFCCHCPSPKGSSGHYSASHGRDGALLQVRRSSFKNAVNATDIVRFGADLAGVQQYTLNGTKIVYLAREVSAKKPGHGAPPPASCTVDGRAMMDKSSLYCSLMCKMQAEDPGFTAWLDAQDPSVRIMAQVAANAPPVPTVACKRGGYSGSSGRDSSSSPKSSGSHGASLLKDSPGLSGTAAGATSGRTFVPTASPRPAKMPRISAARSNSAPLGNGGSTSTEDMAALLLSPLGLSGCSSSIALDGSCKPVARRLMPAGTASTAGSAARQAAAAVAAAAFGGAIGGTSPQGAAASTAAAAAARGALGIAGLASVKTSNTHNTRGLQAGGSIGQQQRQQQQQQHGSAGQARFTASAFAAAAHVSSSGVSSLLPAPELPVVESPRAPGLEPNVATGAGFGNSGTLASEPWLPGMDLPSGPGFNSGLEPSGFLGVGGMLDLQPGPQFMMDGGYGGVSTAAPWGSAGDLAGLLGAADSNSPFHPSLDSFDAMFGDGSLLPAPQQSLGNLF